MSRSYRKTPIIGITKARSEKQDKRMAAQKIRAISRSRLIRNDDTPVDYREAGHGSWDFAKDGKQYLDLAELRENGSPRYVHKLLGK